MIKYLRQLRLFLNFQPTQVKGVQLSADEARDMQQFFSRKAGIKLSLLIDSYVSDCALGACSNFGHEGSYKSGWAMGAMGLRSFIKSHFRTPQAQEGTEVEDESGIPD